MFPLPLGEQRRGQRMEHPGCGRLGGARDVRGGKRTAYPIQSGPTVRFPQKAEGLRSDEAQPERNVERETPGHKRMGHGSIERTV